MTFTQRFGISALTELAQRCPDPIARAEFAEACLLWDVSPGESWNTNPYIPMQYSNTELLK